MAALDALGSLGTNALPVLDELLHEDPFDPHVIYVVARMGLDGMPLLTATLSSTNKQLRLEAGVGLDLIRAHSEVLYPAVPVSTDAPCFQRRITEFNLKIMQAAFQAYRTEHADAAVPAGQQYPLPPPRCRNSHRFIFRPPGMSFAICSSLNLCHIAETGCIFGGRVK